MLPQLIRKCVSELVNILQTEPIPRSRCYIWHRLWVQVILAIQLKDEGGEEDLWKEGKLGTW